jgi:hypothetical protein
VVDWSTVAPALRALFSSLALNAPVTPEFLARWTDKSAELVHPEVGKELTLKVTSVVGIGEDERRYVEVDDDVQESIVGHRRFVIQVRVDSFDHSEDESRWCWSMIERIRTRLRRRSSIDALLAVNVALVEVGSAIDASLTFDKRRVNAALMDVTMAAAFTDTDPVPVGWIEHVEFTTEFRIAAGEPPLPEPPNFSGTYSAP